MTTTAVELGVANGVDLYGPFLGPEQMLREQPAAGEQTDTLILGDYFIKLAGTDQGIWQPNPHERFVLNAVLQRPDGSLQQNDLYRMNFYPDANNERTKQAAASDATTHLPEVINSGRERDVISKVENGRLRVISLAKHVQIVRVGDEQLGQPAVAKPDRYSKPAAGEERDLFHGDWEDYLTDNNFHPMPKSPIDIEVARIKELEARVAECIDTGSRLTGDRVADHNIVRRALADYAEGHPNFWEDIDKKARFDALSGQVTSD